MSGHDENQPETDGNFEFEFRSNWGDLFHDSVWYESPHPARPYDEARALVERLNAADRRIVYRMVPMKARR